MSSEIDAVEEFLGITVEFSTQGATLVKRLVTPSTISTIKRASVTQTGDERGDWLRSYLSGARPVVDIEPLPSVRTAELFCGAGGLALGFGEACNELGSRLESEAACDQDADAVQVYASNHKTKVRSIESASRLVDYQIKGVGESAKYIYEPEMLTEAWGGLVGNVDCLLAGPPCQGHSNLNNHTRRVDRRNELYLTVPAVAIALGVDIVVIENVPAVVHDRSQIIATTKKLLRDHGYLVETGVLSAVKMDWPQARQRFFIVARRSATPLPLATVQAGLGSLSPRSLMCAIEDLQDQANDRRLNPEVELNEENRRRINYLFERDLFDLPWSERPECHQQGTTYNAVYGRLHKDKPAPTLTTGFLTPGRGRYIHPTRPRTLSPWEAARLQGFPDTYDFFPDPRNPPTKLKLTKWIGDAVPMPLGYAAGLSALANGWSRPV